MTDRRIAPRVPVSVYLSQYVDGETHRCFVTNLSSTGLYMERPMGSFLRTSAQVQLEIPLPDREDESIWASAEIVYDCFDALFHGTAVRFVAMTERDRARLSSFIATSAPAVAA
jgi:hypothetical protein